MDGHRKSSCPLLSVMLLPNIYQFLIVLDGVSPPIWRRIQVPGTFRFYALHSAIQDVLGWVGSRTYSFYKFSTRPDVTSICLPMNAVRVPSYEHDVFVMHYFTNVGDTAFYVYEIRWKFSICLEKIFHQSAEVVTYPVCVDGERGCPPETDSVELFRLYSRMARYSWPLRLDAVGHSEQFNRDSVVFKDPKERFQNFHQAPPE